MDIEDQRLERLRKIGFIHSGRWELSEHDKLEFSLEDGHGTRNNVLYAFFVSGRLMYIGKTTQSLSTRMSGYKIGHGSQRTNNRIHGEIYNCLKTDQSVDIYFLPDSGLIYYGGFHLNLSAGLEDDLIKQLNPGWNGGLKETENGGMEPPEDAA